MSDYQASDSSYDENQLYSVMTLMNMTPIRIINVSLAMRIPIGTQDRFHGFYRASGGQRNIAVAAISSLSVRPSS